MTKLPPLIQRLLEPAAYPHAVDRVELLQTHLSWVLLAGEYAYKIKKPVRFDFVDFSTLERRRAACLEELRLNRRFAPMLYLDVAPIVGPDAHASIAGVGEPIEFAVRMRRFAQGELLAQLVERNEVSAQQSFEFGVQLAQVHEASAQCSCPPGQTAATALDNAAELLRTAPEPAVQALVEWMHVQAAASATRIAARSEQMRECHGDLHAGNIVRIAGRLTAFDCIEFSERLRCIDVMSDAAFLFMDLLARGAPALAYTFLNGWLERSGDYDGVALLPLLVVHRALVRAKVNRLGGDRAASERYLALAQRFTPRRPPRLIVMCGLSGSGKTWVSRALLERVGGVRVRSDVERKRLAGLRAEESSRGRPELDLYSMAMNTRVYELLLKHARTIVAAGENAVIDAAFLKRSERLAFAELATQLNLDSRIVYCAAPTEELQRRLNERERKGSDASEATAAVLDLQQAVFEPFDAAERARLIEVNSVDAQSVNAACAALAN